MPTWNVKCPQCGTKNEISAAAIKVDCGQAACTCVCTNCRHEFDNEQPYWRLLGLDEPPVDEKASPIT